MLIDRQKDLTLLGNPVISPKLAIHITLGLSRSFAVQLVDGCTEQAAWTG